MKKSVCMLLALLLLGACQGMAQSGDNWLDTVLGGREGAMGSPAARGAQRTQYAAVLDIDSEISEYDDYYDHIGVLDAIDALMLDPGNAALILRLNTPGGSLYEADELYHSLMLYKQTGRPVYAYMEQECCSAGVYVAMAADMIMAARMTITGNVGVYMQTYSEAGLLDKLGIVNEYIATGENKVAGYPELTPAQREIYQALVDESFDLFKAAITQARGMTEEQMAPFLDGRLLSAAQAKKMGLIDEVGFPDDFYDRVEALHPGIEYRNVTPEAPGAGGLMDLFTGAGIGDLLDLIAPGAMDNVQPVRQKSALKSAAY